jgi:hypothetical protein
VARGHRQASERRAGTSAHARARACAHDDEPVPVLIARAGGARGRLGAPPASSLS